MSFTATHSNGSMEVDPTPEVLDALVGELDGPADSEHADTAVAHESGWSLSAFPSGLVVWEDVEAATEARRIDGATRDDVRALFGLVARGDLDAVEAILDDIAGRQRR